jgi:hypothetical protein
MSPQRLILRSDVIGAVELTSWSSELVMATVAASVDHLQPGFDAVDREEAFRWLVELHTVIVDPTGMSQMAHHLASLPVITDAEVTFQ